MALVVKNWPAERGRFDPWIRNIPWRRAWQPTPAFLPGESHGQRSLEVVESQPRLKQLSTQNLNKTLYCLSKDTGFYISNENFYRCF